MANFSKARAMMKRYKDNVQGSFMTVWVVGLSMSICAIGAGIDVAAAARVSSTAQSAADQVALASAVFYSIHERLPEDSDEGFMNGQVYRGDDAGFNFPNTVRGGNRGVKFKATYDEESGSVQVRVWGRTQTALMSMFGTKTIKFNNYSTAKFKETELKNPASITLVLDNSGSMAWDDKPADCEEVWSSYYRRWVTDCEAPNDASPRIDGLKDSVQGFMGILDDVVGPQAVTGHRVLRTGIIPYDDSIITNRQVEMQWGTISSSDINRMAPSGSTNSAPPIARAWDWLQDETQVHQDETGEDNPLRYMIFMTDGQNSAGRQWYTKSGTNYWRGLDCSGERSRYCFWTYEHSTSQPSIRHHYYWSEGEYISPSDRDSKNSCQAMKDQGVRVFTIGFALEPGTYKTNYPESWGRDEQVIPQSTTDAAYSMMAACASSPTDFITAADTNDLNEAFANIGETIVQDVIRLSQ